MKAYVFTDKALTSRAGQFVWLAIDTEKASNAPAVAKYPIGAWPSFYVIDPRKESVLVRWTGGGTVAQMNELLDAGLAAWKPKGDARAKALAVADELNGKAEFAQAADAYGKLMADAPPGWKEYPRVADAHLFALLAAHRFRECAEAAPRYGAKLAGTPGAVSTATSALDCAVEIDAKDPGRAKLIADAERNAHAVLADPKVRVAMDDRSGLYLSMMSARDDAGDEEGKKALGRQLAAELEAAAAKGKTPDERTVFDSHRLTAYLEIGEPQRAVPMLQQSEKDFPNDYNPPARLAVAYNAMKQYDLALAASDRALAKVYGPRRLQVWRVRSEIYEGKGDREAAKDALRKGIAEGDALPEAQRPKGTLDGLRKRLEKLSATPAAAPSAAPGAR
jgi:tetratricopeptide (TPR) repeat protein